MANSLWGKNVCSKDVYGRDATTKVSRTSSSPCQPLWQLRCPHALPNTAWWIRKSQLRIPYKIGAAPPHSLFTLHPTDSSDLTSDYSPSTPLNGPLCWLLPLPGMPSKPLCRELPSPGLPRAPHFEAANPFTPRPPSLFYFSPTYPIGGTVCLNY